MGFLKNSNHQAVKKMEWIENQKKKKKNSEIKMPAFYLFQDVIVKHFLNNDAWILSNFFCSRFNVSKKEKNSIRQLLYGYVKFD